MSYFIKTNTSQILIKPVLKNFCSFLRKSHFFIFNKTFYKQLDGVAMGSPLGQTLANAFLCYHEMP